MNAENRFVKDHWVAHDGWIASFDILGFKGLANVEKHEFKARLSQSVHNEAVEKLQSSCGSFKEMNVGCLWFSDTFVIFSLDDSGKCYALIQQAAKRFFEECLYARIPLRGAISVGSIIRSQDNRVLMGRAFVDAYQYGEDQDWIGLLLTPMAVKKIRLCGLFPERHDFVFWKAIPMRKYDRADVMAYRLQRGSANFASPFLPILEEMMKTSHSERLNTDHDIKNIETDKYARTVEFLKSQYKWL